MILLYRALLKRYFFRIEAIMELKRCSGSQFDPDLVGIFISKVLSTRDVDKKVAVG